MTVFSRGCQARVVIELDIALARHDHMTYSICIIAIFVKLTDFRPSSHSKSQAITLQFRVRLKNNIRHRVIRIGVLRINHIHNSNAFIVVGA